MHRDAPFSPPAASQQIVDLTRLLEWSREGRLRLPRFQRGFVWKKPDMLALFDSIARGFPIGSLLFARWTDGDEGEDHLGPLRLPRSTGDRLLILDGHQRVVTLAGVLLRDDSAWQGEAGDDRWDICIEVVEERFVHHRINGALPPTMLPVHHMVDVVRFWEWADSARHQIGHERVRRLQLIAQAFQTYRVPITIVEVDGSTAIEIFSRLNTSGRPLATAELFAARAYGAGFDLGRALASLRRSIEARGFGVIPDARLLELARASAGLRSVDLQFERFRADEAEALDRAFDRITGGLGGAFDFLDALGVHTTALLPHTRQLTLLALFFERCRTPTTAQRAFLRRWFWVTAFTGWLTIAARNRHAFRYAIFDFQEALPRDPEPAVVGHLDLDHQASATPTQLDLRQARVRAMLCALLRRAPRGPDGEIIGPRRLAERLRSGSTEAMAPVFGRPVSGEAFRNPANWIFRPPDERGAAAEWLTRLAERPLQQRQAILDSHLVSVEAFGAIQRGRADEFIAIRQRDLVEFEHSFMQAEGVVPPGVP